jgi:hypothetical protein
MRPKVCSCRGYESIVLLIGCGGIEFGGCTKRKGENPCGNLAPCYPIFRRPGSASRSQLVSLQKSFGTCERSPPFPSTSVVPFAARAFLCRPSTPSFLNASARFVADSLAGFVSVSLAGPGRFSCESRFRFSSGVPSLDPLRVPLPVLLKFLSRRSCEFRFRFFDDSCLLSPPGGSLLR